MSNPIINGLIGPIERTFSLVDAFIDTCPEEIWSKKFGGWPVWQHVYHSFVGISFIVGQKGDPEIATPFSPEVGMLKETPSTTPSKAEIKDFGKKMQDISAQYIKKMSDADLAKKNEGLSSRIGKDMTNAATMSMLANHIMYHIGSCDAALREKGLPGVF